jgi:nucleotide-binding universal stress UspA family protein
MYKKIMVSTDGSKLSRKAVASASALAAEFGADLTLVRVVPHYAKTFFDGSSVLSFKEMDQIEKDLTEQAQESLNQLLKNTVDRSVNARTVVTRSTDISGALLKVANKVKADLIVMASHGRGGIKRVLIGSETMQVLTHSEIPVLVIR